MNIKQPPATVSFAALLALLAFSFFTRLSALPVRIWDEARNANNALEMYLNDHWQIPFYEGRPDMWNTKPPLLIWLQVLDLHLFGINEVSIRLPSALAAVLTGLLLWWFVNRQLRKPWAGFLAGAVLATTHAYVFNHA